jgi:hypothetical protein
MHLLPTQLEPVQYNGYAFWNIVVCKVTDMRPKLSPLPIGVSYWHVAYRLYVRLKLDSEEAIEGLYFLRSDCDNELMSFAGNLLTDFNFHSAKIYVSEQESITAIRILANGGEASAIIKKDQPARLSVASPFHSVEEAEHFLKYKPNGISITKAGSGSVVHIVRNEDAWQSTLVHVEQAQWSFLAGKNAEFEICYDVQPIAYQWNRAKIYRCPSF